MNKITATLRAIKSLFDCSERDRERRVEEANSRFNIARIDGRDYITYNGIVISMPSDEDILDRLDSFRNLYISNNK